MQNQESGCELLVMKISHYFKEIMCCPEFIHIVRQLMLPIKEKIPIAKVSDKYSVISFIFNL